MSDLISREFLQTAIHNFFYGLIHTPTEEDIQRYIEVAPSVENKGEWIPVSERLPEEAGRYLCTVGASYRNPREMYYAPQEWADESDQTKWRSTDGSYVYDWFVIAWMPLPEPYKAESEDT